MRTRALVFGTRAPWWPLGLCSIEPEVDEEIPPAGGGTPPAGGTPPVPAPTVVGRGGEIPAERVSEIKRSTEEKTRRALLVEEYGTFDPVEVQKIKDQRKADADELKSKRDAAKAAADAEKTETEKLREQLAAKDVELEAERSKNKTTAQRLEEEKQDRVISGYAGKHVAARYVKAAKVEFAEYVQDLTKAQLADLTPEKIDKWFVKFARDNPALAATAPKVEQTEEEKAAAELAKKNQRAPIPPKRVGAPRPPVPAARPASTQRKNPRDMTKKEFDAYQRSLGRSPAY